MAASQTDSSAADKPFKVQRVVLDTNVVLDWLVFSDPRLAPLAHALEQGELAWIACPRMREELCRTLSYPALAKWKPNSERTLAFFDRLVTLSPDPEYKPANSLLCSDPDDQVFIDLAVKQQAVWLLTRDRALLQLKKRATLLGLHIAPPEVWTAQYDQP